MWLDVVSSSLDDDHQVGDMFLDLLHHCLILDTLLVLDLIKLVDQISDAREG